jgi:hypothetical protein
LLLAWEYSLHKLNCQEKWKLFKKCFFIAIFLAMSPAIRPPLFAGTSQRSTIFLNGSWKFSPSDNTNYKDAAFDDHNWKEIKVPGNWREQGYDNNGFTWYRLHFTPSSIPGKKYRYLRFERILDEGEVWLNGKKLMNPQLGSILRNKQYGSYWGNDGAKKMGVDNYVHLWSFQWPFAFDVTGLINEGQTNVIAVRVYDDPTSGRYWVFWQQPDDTYFGRAGLMGNVELTATKDLSIEDFSYQGPAALTKGKGIFTFRIKTSGAGSVQLKITNSNGLDIFKQEKKTSPNTATFNYTLEPSFSQYKATAELIGAQRKVTDTQTLTFYGICYEVRSTKLFVNGEEFLVKGLNGFPGSKGSGSGTTRWDWLEEDCKLAKEVGANAFRGMNYHPKMLEAGYKYGIFFIPILSDACGDLFKTFLHTAPDDDQSIRDAEISVLAQRESPMILIWSLANEVSVSDAGDKQEEVLTRYFRARQNVVASLDPYRRPTLYSNHAAQTFTGAVDIIGSNDPAGTNDLNWKSKWSNKKIDKPILVTEWALNDSLPYTKEFYRYEDTWFRMIVNPDYPYIGACLFPGLGAWEKYGGLISNQKVNKEFAARLTWLFRDMDFGYKTADDGKSIEVKLVNRRNYALRDLKVSLTKPSETSRELTIPEIAPNSSEPLDVITTWGKITAKMVYQTHHGLPCICNLEEDVNPDSVKRAHDRLRDIEKRIKILKAMDNTANTRIIGENLIKNGGFEAELFKRKWVPGWNLNGGHRLAAEEKHDGNQSMELVGDGIHFNWLEPGNVTGQNRFDYIVIKPMATYIVRFWYKIKANAPLTVNIFTPKRSLTGEKWSIRLVSNEWREYSLKFVTQSDEDMVGIYFYPYYNNKDGKIWIDDVSLYECE